MTTTTNCPHCGAEAETLNYYACDTNILEDIPSNLCMERAARQKAEAEVNDARANADSWRVQSDRFESQLLETSEQLSETRRKLEEATRFVWGAVHNAKPECGAEMARWVCVRNALGVGSTTATALCREHGVDPDEVLKSRCTYTEEAEKGGAS